METTKTINGIEYRINPLGVEVEWVNTDSPLIVPAKVNKIPKNERKAMIPDMSKEEYKWAITDPVGYLKTKMKTDLLYLLNKGLGFQDIDYKGRIPYQKKLANFLKEYGLRGMVLIAREHFKSTIAKGYIVQELLNNPNRTLFVRSHTWKKATTFVDVIQKRIKNHTMRMFFGDLEGDKWNIDSLNLSIRTEHTDEFNLYATGLGTDVTGYHPDDVILDDIVSDDNYNTEEGRMRVIEDYKHLMFVMKQRVLIFGTRWDEFDLYGNLMEKNNDLPPDHPERYKILLMSVYGESDEDGHTPEKGTTIFPYTYRNNKPEKMLGVTKDEDWVASKRLLGPYHFACQILNNPISSTDVVFDKDDFNLWEIMSPDLKKTMDFYLTIDPAGSNEKYSDYTAFVVCGVTPDYNIYVVEAKQEKIDLTNINKAIDRIFLYYNKWQLKKVGIEQGILERAYKKPIKDRMWFQKKYFLLRKLKYGQQPGVSSNKKPERIAGLQPYFEAGVFNIRKNLYDLQNQLIRWRPYTRSHDDLVDALAYQLQLIPRHVVNEVREKTKTQLQKFLERKRGGFKGKNFETKFINKEAVYG